MANSDASQAGDNNTPRHAVPVARLERVEPDLDDVVSRLFWRRGFNPEVAWRIAVSGDTAARMAGTHLEEECTATAELLARAAAFGWWPKRLNGDYVAVPLEQWVAEGHPFTQIVPNAEAMLDRWGIQPVVVDAVANDHPTGTPR